MAEASGSEGKHMGCIGKCTSGLSQKELDLLSDNIDRALINGRGRLIFREYLTQGNRRVDIACLDLYSKCRNIIDDNRTYRLVTKNPTTEQLVDQVHIILTYAEDLDIPEIDLSLLERISDAIDSKEQNDLIIVLDKVKDKLRDHLRQAYQGFRIYVKQPCPRGSS